MLSSPEHYTSDHWMGCCSDHLERQRLSHAVHPAIVDDFLALQASAKEEGIDLQIASAYRDFERQLAIWNAKASGQRPLLDDNGRPLDFDALDNWQIVQAILRWSALPGSSRHHWGSDLDIFDAAAVEPGYRLQLTPQEYCSDGIFHALVEWLPDALPKFGFYRPYAVDAGGTAPEAWHISHQRSAASIRQQLSAGVLLERLTERGDLQLLECVREHWSEIERRFLRPAWA